jgi:hypothetical protein
MNPIVVGIQKLLIENSFTNILADALPSLKVETMVFPASVEQTGQTV